VIQHIDSPYLDVPTAPIAKVYAANASISNAILGCTCAAYQITQDELLGGGRKRLATEARLVTYWLYRVYTPLSTLAIGELLSKDHSTVIAGARRCVRMRERDERFRAFTDELAAAVERRKQA
jgi:chromosomal replication initiation ATPase DnaA